MKSLKKKGDIFSYGKKTLFARLRLPKARWVLGGMAVLLLILFATLSFFPSAKIIKAQDFDANHWWGKEDCNGSEAPYQCEGQEGYPLPSVEELEPIPSLPPLEEYPSIPGGNGIGQEFTGLAQAYQQLQSQLNTCVQQKQQSYTQLASQYQQLRQLERQQDAVSDQISRTTDERRVDSLNDQWERHQDSIDRINDTISDAQSELDEGIADCQDQLYEAQSRIDELESQLYESYNLLLEYELPDYAY